MGVGQRIVVFLRVAHGVGPGKLDLPAGPQLLDDQLTRSSPSRSDLPRLTEVPHPRLWRGEMVDRS